jgi:hypothetical protein
VSIWLVILIVWITALVAFYGGFRFGRSVGYFLGTTKVLIVKEEDEEEPP